MDCRAIRTARGIITVFFLALHITTCWLFIHILKEISAIKAPPAKKLKQQSLYFTTSKSSSSRIASGPTFSVDGDVSNPGDGCTATDQQPAGSSSSIHSGLLISL